MIYTHCKTCNAIYIFECEFECNILFEIADLINTLRKKSLAICIDNVCVYKYRVQFNKSRSQREKLNDFFSFPWMREKAKKKIGIAITHQHATLSNDTRAVLYIFRTKLYFHYIFQFCPRPENQKRVKERQLGVKAPIE